MNYNDLDKEESEKLLKEFFKNNPSFNSGKYVKKLFKERVKNPLLIYEFLKYQKGISISSKFRGVLMNDTWVIYMGDRTKYYLENKNFVYGHPFDLSDIEDGFYQFEAPNMVDITEYVFPKRTKRFINWDKNPFENK